MRRRRLACIPACFRELVGWGFTRSSSKVRCLERLGRGAPCRPSLRGRQAVRPGFSILAVEGSRRAPREAGTRMQVTGDQAGSTGTIGGGNLEFQAVASRHWPRSITRSRDLARPGLSARAVPQPVLRRARAADGRAASDPGHSAWLSRGAQPLRLPKQSRRGCTPAMSAAP